MPHRHRPPLRHRGCPGLAARLVATDSGGRAMRVRKLAVFRGLYLGDLVATTGALRALRCGYPKAEISLISLPWAAALAPHLAHVDRLLPYPGAPGLDGRGNEEDLEEFL